MLPHATVRPLRIAVLGTRGVPSSYSGIERVCETLYAVLAQRGHQVTVYCQQTAGPDEPVRHRGIHRRVVRAPRHRALETLAHTGVSLGHAIARGRYDLLHFHALAPCLFTPLAGIAGIPTVATVHGLDWQRAKWRGLAARVIRLAEQAMVRHAGEIICVSEALSAYYHERYGRPTTYVPNGIEIDPCPVLDDSVLDRFGLRADRYVTFIGRLVPEKRVQDLIVAFGRLNHPGLRLAIVGDARHSAAYAEQLKLLVGGSDRVVFTGPQTGPALASLFARAAVYVSASELEGMPKAVLEAIGYGTPVVLSDIPAHRELLAGVDGARLVAPGDVDGLIKNLRAVLAAAEHHRSVAAQARERAARRYAWASIADATEAVYQRLLARRSQPTPDRG